jgi:aspartate racemase
VATSSVSSRGSTRVLGVLGGMGPAATARFYQRLVAQTRALQDQHHVPVFISADPRVPDRARAVLGTGPSPVPAMMRGVRMLQQAGASTIALPCNTAHAFLPELESQSGADFIDMIGATVSDCRRLQPETTTVGVLATRGTRAAQLYEAAAQSVGLSIVHVDEPTQEELVDRAILMLKAGGPRTVAHGLIEEATQRLRDAGAQVAIAACTELSLVFQAIAATLPSIDSTESLVSASLQAVGHGSGGRSIRER